MTTTEVILIVMAYRIIEILLTATVRRFIK